MEIMIRYCKQIIELQLKLASPPSVIESDKTMTKEMALYYWQHENGQHNYASCKYSQGLRLSRIQCNPSFLWVASAPTEGQGSYWLATWCHFLLWAASDGKPQQWCESAEEGIGLQGSKWSLVSLGKVGQVLACLSGTQEWKSQRGFI